MSSRKNKKTATLNSSRTSIEALAEKLNISVFDAIAVINNYLLQQLIGGGYAHILAQTVVSADALKVQLSNGWQFVTQLKNGDVVVEYEVDLSAVTSAEDLDAKLSPLGIKSTEQKSLPATARNLIYRTGEGQPTLPVGRTRTWRCFTYNGQVICYQS